MKALANKPKNVNEVLRRAIALRLDHAFIGPQKMSGTMDDLVEQIAADVERQFEVRGVALLTNRDPMEALLADARAEVDRALKGAALETHMAVRYPNVV